MKDFTGVRFKELVAIRFYKKENKKSYWVFLCDCGNEKVKSIKDAQRKKIKKCNCQIKGPNSLVHNYKHSGLYLRYRRCAIRRNYEFNISTDFFESLIFSNCHYCNSEPSTIYKDNRANYNTYIYNGIDRKNNSIGYTQENCVTCCKICNRAKLDMTYEDYKDWISKIKNM